MGLRAKRIIQATFLAAALTLASGCTKHTAPASQPDDTRLVSDVTSRLSSDQGLAGQQIQAQVSAGVAVLTGTVDSQAAKGLAAADAQQVPGIKSVVNNLSIAPPQTAAAPAPAPAPVLARPTPRKQRRQTEQPPPPPQQLAQNPPDQPTPPPRPITRTYTLTAGTVIPVRMIDSLQTGVTQSNTSFRASLAADLVQDGLVVVRQGTIVVGRVIEAKDATHYAGSSALTLELQRINTNQSLSIVTDPYTEQGRGRGKNTAAKVGGGAALGAIIGAIAGGGKGAAIGSVAGGGIGAGANTITRGQQVSIPAETIVRFRLSAPVQVTTTVRAEQTGDNPQPTLQPRQ